VAVIVVNRFIKAVFGYVPIFRQQRDGCKKP
jgi:hypothetical protein